MMTQHRLLFVGQHNTCRSVLAEAAMRQLIAHEDRLDDFLLASRGLKVVAGSGASQQVLGAAGRQGMDLAGFRARQIDSADFRNFDLLLAMDADSRDRLVAMAPAGSEHRVHLLLDFSPWIGIDEVPVPSSDLDEAADDLFDLVLLAARGLVEVIDKSGAELVVPVSAAVSLKASSSR
jgi:protein-tyrosine phosphatase